MGKYYYKGITEEEYYKLKPKFLVKKEGIKNEKELCEFMAKEQCIREPLGGL